MKADRVGTYRMKRTLLLVALLLSAVVGSYVLLVLPCVGSDDVDRTGLATVSIGSRWFTICRTQGGATVQNSIQIVESGANEVWQAYPGYDHVRSYWLRHDTLTLLLCYSSRLRDEPDTVTFTP